METGTGIMEEQTRSTRAGKTNMFSGVVRCVDCWEKLYYCTSRHFEARQDYFVCSPSRLKGKRGLRDTFYPRGGFGTRCICPHDNDDYLCCKSWRTIPKIYRCKGESRREERTCSKAVAIDTCWATMTQASPCALTRTPPARCRRARRRRWEVLWNRYCEHTQKHRRKGKALPLRCFYFSDWVKIYVAILRLNFWLA